MTSSTPQKDDQLLLAQYIRDAMVRDQWIDCLTIPSDRTLRRYIDDYTSTYDLQKARDELEPILPLLRQLVSPPLVPGRTFRDQRSVRAEALVDRVLAALRYMGFAP